MKLTTSDKALLSEWGFPDKDFAQIEEAFSNTTCTLSDDTQLSRKATIERLGRETYLGGIARSAFHRTAARKDTDGVTIYFDSSKLFK